MNLLQQLDIGKIKTVITQLENDLLEKYDPEKGCWTGKQWMNAAVSAEFLILCKYINYEDPSLIKACISEILSSQKDDGGWPSYHGGPSELSLSCICYLGLELYREYIPENSIQKSKNFINEHGGLENAMLLPKFYYFIFGKYPVRKLPEMRPELNIVPKWLGFSVYDMASWVRSWLVPLSIVWHQEKYKNYRFFLKPYIVPLRKWGLKKATKWLLDHQQSDGSWYSVFHSTMMSVLALKSLGYTLENKNIKKGMEFILSLQDRSATSVRQQAFLGPVWDTALALNALDYSDGSIYEKGTAYLLSRQILCKGDWYQHNKIQGAAWAFEDVNEYYPDVDSTSTVLKTLKHYKKENKIQNGIKWLLSMQNNDGSWSAFDKNNNHSIIEFYLALRNYNIGKGRGLVLDRGSPDLTAHALEALAYHDFDKNDKSIQKAISWIKKNQEKDGAWFGRWGICYLYGSGAVLQALKAVGEDMTQEYVQNAIEFIKKSQNSDGGFGEVGEAYYDPQKKAKGKSTITQSSWALSALIDAGEINSQSVKKGMEYLMGQIKSERHLIEMEFQAVAAPPLFQRYELYPYYFPLMTFRSYLKAIE